ncbi:MAG: phenylalanine--tRNA ligase subunit beta [Bacteroidota bacterium]
MKISYNWLKELIDIKLSVNEVSELLTGCGLEVEGVTPYQSIKGGLEGIVVGEVKTKMKHPNADKLSVTTVNIGGDTDLQIVCGAPNVDAGQKVLVATVGATVHPTKGEPFKINKSKIRGEVSEGMICAEDELGLGESHDGILVLPENYEVGKKAIEYFNVYEDYLIEIGLTANRGDAASHLGVARDLKALTNSDLRFKNYELPQIENRKSQIEIRIEDAEGCIRYSGISISNITVKESPEWLKNKLKVIGLSPINNIVDATNYVLHEIGQPLHAFDTDKIAGQKIVVKKVAADTKFVTLDKVERKLNGNECMICDADKPLAIAGVFGGLESGINEQTKNIFIESACFNPVSIRKAAKFHGLNTDASFRFERGTDPNVTVKALERFTQIILEIAGGEVSSDVVDIYPTKIENSIVEFSIERFNKLIGQVIPFDEVKRILTALEITITNETTTQLTLSIPPYRVDVKREADVAEEILRIYGLNKIEIPTQLKSAIVFSDDDKKYKIQNKIADHLSATGFYELINNSLTASKFYSEDEMNRAVKILNPLSTELDIMRMNMLYCGLESVQYNLNRKAGNLKFFEFGYTYELIDGKYIETPHYSILLCGLKTSESWNTPQKAVNYFTIKGVVVNVLQKLGINKISFDYNDQHSKLNNHTSVYANGKLLAEFGSVNHETASKVGINETVYFADLYWNQVAEISLQAENKHEIISQFPFVRRDLALLLDKSVKYSVIEKIALSTDSKLIKSVNVFDVYEGDKMEAGKKSYAISFIIQDDLKTLTDTEIETVMNKLINRFTKELGAALRA